MNNYIEEVIEMWLKEEEDKGEYVADYGNLSHKCLDGEFDLIGLLKQAIQKQQDIIKECLPEESKDGDEYCDCFNECRQQFLDNLSKKGINLN